jgi:hypothetical protein
MNKIMKISPILLCFAVVSAFAQEAGVPVEPAPPRPPGRAIAPVPAVPPLPPLPDIVPIPVIRGIAQAVEASTAAALAQTKEAVEQAKAAARAQADFALQLGKQDPHAFLFRHSSTKAGRTLVIPGKDFNASTANALEEDLNVMARIFEKAIERKSEDDGPKAMGIDLFSSTSSSGVRNLYVDGYGAVFILKVRYPLIPPPEKTEQTKTNEPTSSEWTETWQDLYGSKGGWDADFNKGFAKEWKGSGSPAEEYDADKVEKLKVAILEALKNATNIRNLRSDEKVVVAVSSSSAGDMEIKRKRSTTESRGGGGGRGGGTRSVETRDTDRRIEGSGQSVLTMQAKKSDIDSFAKGKLTLDEFRKKVAVILY